MGKVSSSLKIPESTINLVTSSFNIPEYSLSQDHLKLLGNIQGNSSNENSVILGELNLEALDFEQFLVENNLIEGGALPLNGVLNVAAGYSVLGDKVEINRTAISLEADQISIFSEAPFTAVDLSAGMVEIPNITGKLNEADFQGHLNIRDLFTAEDLALEITQKISRIDMGQLLRLFKVADNLEGMGDVGFELDAITLLKQNPLATMNGGFNFKIDEGAIKGFDLQGTLIKIDKAINSYKQESSSSNYQPDAQTKFSELSASFSGADGIFISRDLNMKAPGLRVNGEGEIDFQSESIHFNFNVSVVDSFEGQGGDSLENLEDISVPLVVKGPMASPTYSIDVAKLFKNEVEKKVKQELKKELNEQLLKLLGD